MGDKALSHPQEADYDDVSPTPGLESRHTIFEATIHNTQDQTWPHGTQQYAAQVDDYESDEEDEMDNEEDCYHDTTKPLSLIFF